MGTPMQLKILNLQYYIGQMTCRPPRPPRNSNRHWGLSPATSPTLTAWEICRSTSGNRILPPNDTTIYTGWLDYTKNLWVVACTIIYYTQWRDAKMSTLHNLARNQCYKICGHTPVVNVFFCMRRKCNIS